MGMLIRITAPRGRAQDATPDQREKARVAGQGRVSPVSMAKSRELATVLMVFVRAETWKAVWLLRARSLNSATRGDIYLFGKGGSFSHDIPIF
jgi:hypothetical protein